MRKPVEIQTLSINSISPVQARNDAESTSAMKKVKQIIPMLYVLFLMLPIYFLICNSFKTDFEIKNSITPIPMIGTLTHYKAIFSDSQSSFAYLNSLLYVIINNLISLIVDTCGLWIFPFFIFGGQTSVFLVSR